MMKRIVSIIFGIGLSVWAFNIGCGSEGETGTAPANCGSHGSLHNGHCDCDKGYLSDGKTCVLPSEITEICKEEPIPLQTDASTEEHHDEACLCPTSGKCPCDHGKVETFATKNYCVPEPDEV